MMSGRLRMAGHGYRRHQAHFPHERFLQQPLPIAPCVSQEGNSQRINLPMTSGVLRTAQPGQPQRLPRRGAVGSLLSLCRLTGAYGFWEDSGAACMQISGLQRTVSAGYRRPHKLNLGHAFLIASLRTGNSCGSSRETMGIRVPSAMSGPAQTDANGLWSRAVPNSHLASRKVPSI